MPFLIIPSETGLIRPSGPLEIDWNSGLTQGLRYFFLCDGKGMTDLVTGKRYAATGGSGTVGRYGPAWVSGGAGTRIAGPSGVAAQAVGNFRTGSGVTAFVSGVFTTAGASAAAISCANTAAVGGWTLKSEQYNNTGNVGFNSYSVGSDYNSTIATPVGSSVISIRMSANANTYYKVNSLPITSTANTAPATTGDQVAIGAAIRTTTYRDEINSGDYVYWGAIYNEDVAEGLRHVLHTRPFGSLVVRKNSRTYFFPSAASGPQSITPTGLSSEEAFGTAVIGRGAVLITPSGIDTAEAFGTAAISNGAVTITPGSIESAEAIGSAVIGVGAVSITPSGIASAETFGTTALTSLYTITANAIATAEAFGTAVLSTGAVSVLPSGITTAEAIGAAVVSQGFVILPLSIESLEALGNPVLTVGNVTILPAGIASSETIGAVIVGDVIIVADLAFINDLVQNLVKDITGRLNG